ncbi:hypothetical protein BB561_003775 [Smittium simulii]|uniref:Uncharacterized protein n=1 Tax=Smittium simulii TaxID=133385 RepID=A0A2T9YJL8_9FUNG|nr:hypothetical protein BB561_003775 [Smittium simulii]
MSALSLSLNLQAELVSRVITAFFGASLQKYPDYIMRFQKFCLSIFTSTQVSTSAIFLALLYFKRLYQSPNFSQAAEKIGSEFSMFSVSLMLASKYLDDNTFATKTWAKVSLVPVSKFFNMQNEFLKAIDYKLYVDPSEYYNWSCKLDFFYNSYSNPSSPCLLDSNTSANDYSTLPLSILPNQLSLKSAFQNNSLGKHSRDTVADPTSNTFATCISNLLLNFQNISSQNSSFNLDAPSSNFSSSNSMTGSNLPLPNKRLKSLACDFNLSQTPSKYLQQYPLPNKLKNDLQPIYNYQTTNSISNYPQIKSVEKKSNRKKIAKSFTSCISNYSFSASPLKNIHNSNDLPSIVDFYYNNSPNNEFKNTYFSKPQLQNFLVNKNTKPQHENVLKASNKNPNYLCSLPPTKNFNSTQNSYLSQIPISTITQNSTNFNSNSDKLSTTIQPSSNQDFSNVNINFSHNLNCFLPNNFSSSNPIINNNSQLQLSQPCFY